MPESLDNISATVTSVSTVYIFHAAGSESHNIHGTKYRHNSPKPQFKVKQTCILG